MSVVAESDAVLSEDGAYRYQLWRRWDSALPTVNFVGLNPSKADAEQDDPTIRRMRGFAVAWGFGALVVTNLFAYRSTDPRLLRWVDDPHGPDNRHNQIEAVKAAGLVIACWGGHAMAQAENAEAVSVLRCWRDVHVIGTTRAHYPAHPLYLRADSRPRLYVAKSVTGWGDPRLEYLSRAAS